MIHNPLLAQAFRKFLLGAFIVVTGCTLFVSDYQLPGRILMLGGVIWEGYTIYNYLKNLRQQKARP